MSLRIKLIACCAACAVLATSLVWLVGWTPSSKAGVVTLCILAAICGGILAAITNWNPRLKAAVGGGLVIIAVLVGYLAIPQATPEGSDDKGLDEVTVEVSREIDLTKAWRFSPSDSQPSQAPPQDNCNALAREDWLRGSGATEVGENLVRVAITSDDDATVLIREMRLTHYERRQAKQGSDIKLCAGGGPEPISYTIKLDGSNPSIKSETQSIPDDLGYFELAAGTTKVFSITALAIKGEYEWAAEITMLRGDESRTIRVDDLGEPFRVTS